MELVFLNTRGDDTWGGKEKKTVRRGSGIEKNTIAIGTNKKVWFSQESQGGKLQGYVCG